MQFTSELRPEILQVQRLLKKYLPTVADPEWEYSVRGKNFSTAAYVSRYGSGYEKPMLRKGDLEQKGLLLEIMLDISGSMSGDRIINAVKACLVVLEASKEVNIDIEILASDHQTFLDKPEYIIKALGEKYDGQVKQRLIGLINQCLGNNNDAAAIWAALPRIEIGMRRMRNQMDRSTGLSVFISDSTSQSQNTRQAAENMRKKIPFEGMVISNDPEIAKMVRSHFGENSVVPTDVKVFPRAFQTILERYIRNLREKD